MFQQISPYSIPVGIASIGFLFLSSLVYSKNKKSSVNINFAVFNFLIFVWLFSYAICYSTQNDKIAYFFAKTACVAVFLFAPFMYSFTVAFLKIESEKKFIRRMWIFIILFLPFLIFSKYFLSANKHYWGYYSKAGPLYPLALALWYFVILKLFYLLFKNYKKKNITLVKKTQIKYLFLFFFILNFCGIDYIQKFGVEIYPFGWIFAIPSSLLMAYAIFRYRLIEIETIIHQTFIWFLLSLSLFIPLGAIFYFSTDYLKNLNSLNFSLALIFTVYLFSFFKSKLQPRIDHFFRRRAYNYQQALLNMHEKIAIVQNLDLAAKKFLTSLDEILYPRQCFLLVKQKNEYILKEKIGRIPQNISLSFDHSLSLFIEKEKKLLEKEQIIIDPKYQKIKPIALKWFNLTKIEILFPILLVKENSEEILALIGLGEKSSLKPYTLKDLELLERLGKQAGIYFYNALHYGELEREKEKVENIISFMPDGLILLDEKNGILRLNPKAKEILKMEDINEKDLSKEDIVNYPSFAIFLSFIEKQKKLRQTGKLEETFFLKDDYENDLIYEATLSYFKELKGILIILRDITREKAVDKMKSEFISIAAHQLRTPLSAIKWVIKMILDGDTGAINAEQKDLLDKGYQSNERMIKLVNDLLNISRIDEGKFLYQFSEESLEKLIEEIVNLINPLAEKNKIKIIFNKPSEALPKLKIDKEKIFLAIQNLAENAIRYSSNNSKVIISAKYDKIKKKVVVEVKDNGIGIPKNQQFRIFTKFFRGDNITKTQTEGSGLGLFIVKNIIEAHKGKVWFESEEKKGSSFYFSLPLYNNKKL